MSLYTLRGAAPTAALQRRAERRDDEARPGSDIVSERPESVMSGRTLEEVLRDAS